MKKLLGIVVLGLLLYGCGAPSNYSGYKDYWQKRGYNYAAKACPESGRGCWWSAGTSQAEANRLALNACNQRNSYCVIFKEGNRTVSSTEDAKIAYAKNMCRKVGYTPNTNDFRDCTIKMMSASGEQQTVIVGSGNRQQLLRPYALGCRSMGGMANC